MFSALLRMYQSHSSKTPMEDFTTELLRGVLASNQELIDDFVKYFFPIQESGFGIETQKSYPTSKIDMVISNKSTVIFIENKVNSVEGNGQLKKYAQILFEIEKEEKKSCFLGYCTKWLDEKASEAYEPLKKERFKYFRWKDIYDFLKKSSISNDGLVKYFLKYLEQQEMSRANEFTIEDMISMRRMLPSYKAMEECVNNVIPIIKNLFGDVDGCSRIDLRRSKIIEEMEKNNRYGVYTKKLTSGEEYVTIFVGFTLMNEDKSYRYPLLCVDFYVEEYSDFLVISDVKSRYQRYCNDAEILEYDYDFGKGFNLLYEKPLSDFLGNSNQFEEINEWFAEKITSIHSYMTRSRTAIKWIVNKQK